MSHNPGRTFPPWPLLHYHSSINAQYLAGDEAGLIGDEEGHGIGDVLWLPEPAHRRHLNGHVLELLGQIGCQVGLDKSWRHGIDGDVTGTDFLARALVKPMSPALEEE